MISACMSIHVCVYINVCVCVCISVSKYVCIYLYVCLSFRACMCAMIDSRQFIHLGSMVSIVGLKLTLSYKIKGVNLYS